MAGNARSFALGTILLVCLVQLPLCNAFEPREEDLKAWKRFQHLTAAVTNLVMPSASATDDELIELPASWDLPLPSSLDNACTRDLYRTLMSLNESWALQMLDADAKPPSGLMNFNLNWMGDLYECQNVQAPATINSSGFRGRYCTLKLSVETGKANLSISAGICVPSSCNSDELNNLTNLQILANRAVIKGFRLPSLRLQVTCPMESSLDASAIGMLCLLGVFLVLMTAGTSVTLAQKWQSTHSRPRTPSSSCYTILEDSKGETRSIQDVIPAEEPVTLKFLKCFCVLTNGSKILSTSVKGDLACVHGIRFLSMTWVILGHTYAFAITVLLFTGGIRELMDELNNLPFQAIMQGTYSVDSFFLLSGFLLTYLFLREASAKEGKIPWGFFYIHRYWRLTPVYAIVLGFNTALTVYVSDGPLWPSGSFDPNCRKSWWWNMLYINNFQAQAESCMGWSWYLANDMQFYVVSPIFLYVLWRWPKIGLSMISGLMLSSWIGSGVISYHYDMLPGYATISNADTNLDIQTKISVYFEKMYIKPYTRVGPYLIGMVLGYAVWHQINHRKPISQAVQVTGWLLATAGGLSMVYGFYHSHPNPVVSALYNALSRSIFSASLAWLIYACLIGCGGPVNRILSWNALMPLSRLTYCAYLVHPIILIAFYSSLRAPIKPTHVTMVALFLGFLVMSYACAFVCSLAFESSLMALEKLVLTRFRKSERRS